MLTYYTLDSFLGRGILFQTRNGGEISCGFLQYGAVWKLSSFYASMFVL
jgi:hypothetical protein